MVAVLVDSHCHLHFPELIEEVPAVLQRMRESNVGIAVSICTDLVEADTLRKLVDEHAELYASIGIHPNADRAAECDASEIKAVVKSHDKFVAIGECGLDYHYGGNEARSWQQERMEIQAEVALDLGMPLVVHTRDSIDDAMDLLHPYMQRGLGAVLHCFTGTWDQATRALDEGFVLSFTGIITFSNATELLDVAANVPDDKVMVETDAPYLAPVPLRGKRNEPSYVKLVLEHLALARKMDMEELEDKTAANALSFYGISMDKDMSSLAQAAR